MKARFFCENCGTEVRAGERSCPSCGKLFTAVRCPECGLEGVPADFASGCPACGYSVSVQAPKAPTVPRRAREPSRLVLSPAFYRVAAIVLAAIVILLLATLLRRA